jgi:hypothetical protein
MSTSLFDLVFVYLPICAAMGIVVLILSGVLDRKWYLSLMPLPLIAIAALLFAA